MQCSLGFYATALYFIEAKKTVKNIKKSVDILRVSRYN